jgi:hypothetical protein
MARSNNVLSVLGMLCISREFRKDFFENPQALAESVVGKLSSDEVEQVLNLAGKGKLPAGMKAADFVSRLQEALDSVYVAARCPNPPCPPALSHKKA